MKIGIDARLYGTKHAGLGRYTLELVDKLQEIDQQNEYVIFLQAGNFEECRIKNINFRKVLADFKAYSFGEQLLFPSLIRRQKLDLMHFPHFNVPFIYRGRYVVTIHDLIISHHPNSRATTLPPWLYKLKLYIYNLVVKSAAQRADKIIAVSNFTKKDVISLLAVKEDKIKVIYEGFNLPSSTEGECQKLLERQGIGDEFLLYVGAAYPHKNLEKLIQAFEMICSRTPGLQLVLVGKLNFFYERLKQYVLDNHSEINNLIIFTGYLSDQELSCLYQRAKLYVFPSLIEGFGLPPLEAQAYNLPVVSSDSSCLPEVLGDSAIYFKPDDFKDMAEKIMLGLCDVPLRSRLAEKGSLNIRQFSWEKMAQEILALYYSTFTKS